jgi:hypothetical protein
MAVANLPPERPGYLRPSSLNSPNDPPDAAFWTASARAVSSALRYLQKTLFSFVRTYEDTAGTGATSSAISAKTEVWRGRFVVPKGATTARVFIYHGDYNDTATNIAPRVLVSVQDVTAAGAFVEYRYDQGIVKANVLYGIDKLRMGELRIPVTATHVYNVKVEVQDYATPLAVVGISEFGTFTDLVTGPAVEEQITDARSLALRSAVDEAWRYNGAHLLNWSPFNSSEAITAAGGYSSWANVFGGAITIPWVLRSRISKGAKIRLAAYATCSASTADRLRITNASGSITLSIGGSASPAWYETTGRFSGSDETITLDAQRNGSDWTLYAVAIYLLED